MFNWIRNLFVDKRSNEQLETREKLLRELIEGQKEYIAGLEKMVATQNQIIETKDLLINFLKLSKGENRKSDQADEIVNEYKN